MTHDDFNSSLKQTLTYAPLTAEAPRDVVDQVVRRDQRRTRILATFCLFFWLLFAAGMLLLVYGLNDFIISLRVDSPEDFRLLGTNLIHHSMPYIAGAMVALPLAALCTVLLIFSSRQATLKRINLSLMRISAQLNQRPGTSGQSALTPIDPLENRLPSAGAISRKVFFGMLMALLLVGAVYICYLFSSNPNPWSGYPRLSPFEAIQWQQEVPQVQVHGTWYRLLSIDDVPVAQIVTYSKSMGPNSWQKHFNEDLVELLILMGHSPGKTANLRVEDPNGSNVQILRDVPMTGANRLAIWKAGTTQP